MTPPTLSSPFCETCLRDTVAEENPVSETQLREHSRAGRCPNCGSRVEQLRFRPKARDEGLIYWLLCVIPAYVVVGLVRGSPVHGVFNWVLVGAVSGALSVCFAVLREALRVSFGPTYRVIYMPAANGEGSTTALRRRILSDKDRRAMPTQEGPPHHRSPVALPLRVFLGLALAVGLWAVGQSFLGEEGPLTLTQSQTWVLGAACAALFALVGVPWVRVRSWLGAPWTLHLPRELWLLSVVCTVVALLETGYLVNERSNDIAALDRRVELCLRSSGSNTPDCDLEIDLANTVGPSLRHRRTASLFAGLGVAAGFALLALARYRHERRATTSRP